MKNLKVLSIALFIATSSLFASEIVPDIPVKEIRTQVVELFDEVPDFYVEEDVLVNIEFTFSSEGDIVVLNVDSKNREILKYVRNYMNHKYIDTPGEPNRLFTLPLRIAK